MKILITALLVSFFWVAWHFCVTERARYEKQAIIAERDNCYNESYQLKREIAKAHKSWIKIRDKK